jgi:hypothetical protein
MLRHNKGAVKNDHNCLTLLNKIEQGDKPCHKQNRYVYTYRSPLAVPAKLPIFLICDYRQQVKYVDQTSM